MMQGICIAGDCGSGEPIPGHWQDSDFTVRTLDRPDWIDGIAPRVRSSEAQDTPLVFIEIPDGDVAYAASLLTNSPRGRGAPLPFAVALFPDADAPAMLAAIEAGFDDAFALGDGESAFRLRKASWIRQASMRIAMRQGGAEAYESAREREERLVRLVQTNPLGMLLSDARGRIIEANDNFLAMIGRTREELEAGRISWRDITPPEWLESDLEAIAEARRKGWCTPYEKEYLHRDGHRVPVLIGSNLFGERREMGAAYVLDLASWRSIEESLRRSEERFQDLANNITQIAWMADASGQAYWFNRRWYEFTGLPAEESADKRRRQVHHPDHAEHVARRFGEAIARGEPWEDTFPLRRHDGVYRWFLTRAVPIRDAQGTIVRWFGTNTDITELREETCRAERLSAKLEAVLDAVQDGVVVSDMDANIFLVNEAHVRIHAFDQEGETTKNISFYQDLFELRDLDGTLVPEERWPLRRVLRGESFAEWHLRVRRQDLGREWVYSYGGQPIRDRVGTQFLGLVTIRDVTDQWRAAEESRASEGRARQLAESMPQIVWTAGPDGTVDYYNQRWAEFSGIPVESGHGWGWAPVVHPEDEEKTMRAWTGAVSSGTAYACEHRIRRRDGQFRWHLSRGIPMKDEQGRVLKWFGTATDIHEQKRVEEELRQTHEDLRQAHDALRQANEDLEARVRSRTAELEGQRRELEASNAELQQFAYVASHDLQEPLRTVTSCTQYLSRRFGQDLGPEAQEFMGFVIDGSKRMQSLIQDLLAFSRVGSERDAVVETSAEEALAAALQNLAAQLAQAQAEVHHARLPAVRIRPTQLIQLFQNLVGNAIKFHKPGTSPLVRIEARRLQAEWVFSVRDNGIGIDREYGERIFQIFQRLHGREEYPGSGIGLSICRKIVESHGGRIWVESAPGEGAEFLFTLPVLGHERAVLSSGAAEGMTGLQPPNAGPKDSPRPIVQGQLPPTSSHLDRAE